MHASAKNILIWGGAAVVLYWFWSKTQAPSSQDTSLVGSVGATDDNLNLWQQSGQGASNMTGQTF